MPSFELNLVVANMWKSKHSIKAIICVSVAVLLVVLPCASCLPTSAICNADENSIYEHDAEDCLEEKMHPDLRFDTIGPRMISGENTNNYWLQKGKEFVREKARIETNLKKAKNIILFLGDGMGLTTIAAARNLLGGEEMKLSFESFPYTGLSKIYSVDKIVPDSACTSTSYLCGVKANYGTIGVNGKVTRGDCEAMRDSEHHVYSIAKWAIDAGKEAGFVTTTRVTHASPAGVYAHTADRYWENDVMLQKDCGANADLSDIGQQLVHGEVGSKLKVMLGGGKSDLIASNLYSNGFRGDGRNLIEEYLEKSKGNVFVETKAELSQLNLDETERLLGVFSNSHMDYHLEALQDAENTQPTLEEMTKRALELLQAKSPNGYFLFVEGGKIDLGHHGTMARIALDETVEFSKAVLLARAMTSDDDTLIVVTADHSHTFSVAGYQSRGSDVFNVAPIQADDNKSYLSLSYANGPSFDAYFNTEKHSRRNPEKVLTDSVTAAFPATVPLGSETHGGEDVAVYASGPWSHLFTGVYEQNAIPHMMAYAACVGDGLKACD